jgi:hypothetical protein
LLVQKYFLFIRITYLSQFLSDLLISNLLSFNCALFFRIGQNLSNIPRSILSKQKFPLILPLTEHKAFRSYLFNQNFSLFLPLLENKAFLSYLFSLDLPPFLVQSFAIQVEYCVLGKWIYAQSFLFSSVPINHSFRSRQQNNLLAQGNTQGSMLQQCTNKTLTTSPFGNTCEVDEISSEVEAGVVVGLRCLQPS